MEIVVTAWALNSYLELTRAEAVTTQAYKKTVRPDVLLLESYPVDSEFRNSKFWSAATDHAKNRIQNGFKMTWPNLGSGKTPLRLTLGMFSQAMLCEAYGELNPKAEQRAIARFKVYLELIRRDQFTECGRLA